jgi:hypothetical protein
MVEATPPSAESSRLGAPPDPEADVPIETRDRVWSAARDFP